MANCYGAARSCARLRLQISVSVCASLTVLGLLIASVIVSEPELPGTYTTDHHTALETLVLLPDGKLVQDVALKYDSQILTANGTWTYDAASQSISFGGDFLSTGQDHLGQPTWEPGSARYEVGRKWDGGIRIGSVEFEAEGATVYHKEPSW